MPDSDKDITNPSGDQDCRQDVHRNIVSGVVANLIGDRERHRRQHEMAQDLYPALGEHEVGENGKYEADHCDKS
jgi:hypothetical protein